MLWEPLLAATWPLASLLPIDQLSLGTWGSEQGGVAPPGLEGGVLLRLAACLEGLQG